MNYLYCIFRCHIAESIRKYQNKKNIYQQHKTLQNVRNLFSEFSNHENFEPLARNLKFIDYQNAQIILIGAREGKDTLTQELGITAENERENDNSANKFTRLRIRKDQVPIKSLLQGKLE